MSENIILPIIASIPGIVSIITISIYIYTLRKKSKKTVKAIGFSGLYKLAKAPNSKSEFLTGSVQLSLLNDRDDSVVITDIIGHVHYDKERYKKNDEMIIKSTPHQLPYISAPPQNFDQVIPTVIKPHEAVKIELIFTFPYIFSNLLYRAIPARFGGFIGENPIMVSDEREYIRNWDNLPITMYITLHIDGKEDIKAIISLEKENPENIYTLRGTYWSTDIARIGRDIWEGKW